MPDSPEKSRGTRVSDAAGATPWLTPLGDQGQGTDRSSAGQPQKLAQGRRPVAVLIPSRTDEYLDRCLKSLHDEQPGSLLDAPVIVGDNGISPHCRTSWEQFGVTFVDVRRPFVFAQAINTCAANAPLNADLLILNDDTTMVTRDWLTILQGLLDDTRSTYLERYGMLSLMIDGGVGNEDQKVRSRPLLVQESPRVICFVAVVVPRAVWDVVGPLDERFTGYGYDDNDYNIRVRRAGFKCGVLGAVTVTHGVAGYAHSSTYAKVHGPAGWDSLYNLNREIFGAKYPAHVAAARAQTASKPPQLPSDTRRCLNLGCGDRPKTSTHEETWTNVDIQALPGVDVVRDLRRGLPFGDASFDHVWADNVLEHFHTDDVIFILNEIGRVLREHGTAEIVVPHGQSQGAVQDPTHKSFFVPRSVLYWNQMMSKCGGRFVGITANLVPLNPGDVETFGDMTTEAFIRFKLTKLPLPTTQKETP